MKSHLLLLVMLPSILFAQSTPPSNFQTTIPSVSYLRDFGDTINFEGYPSYSGITDQYLSNGAIFSGYNGSGVPVTYDYGPYSFTSTLHSDDWYNPLKLKWVDPLDSTVIKPISQLTFFNPISSEIDYIKVVVYNKIDSPIASYMSISPEWVTIDLVSNVGAYAVFDDSAFTAYVIDNLSFHQSGVASGSDPVSSVKSSSVVYPNPFSESAAIMIDPSVKINNATFKMFDALGNMVLQINEVNRNSIIIQRGNLRGGVYHYRLMEQDKRISDGMLVIQ